MKTEHDYDHKIGYYESNGSDLGDLQYTENLEQEKIKNLILISRLALTLYNDTDGHPITHITGVPIEEILKYAKVYATGVNIGMHMPHKDFPHSKNLT